MSIHLNSAWKRMIVRALHWPFVMLLRGKVRSGPFRNISIPINTFGSAMLPKILGTYEKEISCEFENLIKNFQPNVFLDIGCAGGYYIAIALALDRQMKVVGIDSNASAISACENFFKSQNSRVEFVHAYASVSDVESRIARDSNALVMMDIEGHEKDFFDNVNIKFWSNTALLIEVHRFLGIDEQNIINKFCATHSHKTFEFKKYYLHDEKGCLNKLIQLFLRHELRHPNTVYLSLVPN